MQHTTRVLEDRIISDGHLLLASMLIIRDDNSVLLLYRSDHDHWETPGGKVQPGDCVRPEQPLIDDYCRTALRETHEELGNDIVLSAPELAYAIAFKTPHHIPARAYKFKARILQGTPQIVETKIFTRCEYLPIAQLEQYPLAPDLRMALSEIKKLDQY